MGPSQELRHVLSTVIQEIDNEYESVHKLSTILPTPIILGALDILDRQKVIKQTNPISYPLYQILGSSDTYSVLLSLAPSPLNYYCSCPAFAYLVLGNSSEIMCKHILAVQLADKLSLYIERPMNPQDIELFLSSQYN